MHVTKLFHKINSILVLLHKIYINIILNYNVLICLQYFNYKNKNKEITAKIMDNQYPF